MSSLNYYAYPGVGKWATELMGYSQAVRVGDRIETAGQGGWNFDTDIPPTFSEDPLEQIDHVFKTIDKCLRDAGGKGWSQVFRVNSYHVGLSPEIMQRMGENFKKWMPDHKPIWSEVGVERLATPEMLVEIEVVAYDPQG